MKAPTLDERAGRLVTAGWKQDGVMWTHPRYASASFTLGAAERAEADPDRPRRMLAEAFGRTRRDWTRAKRTTTDEEDEMSDETTVASTWWGPWRLDRSHLCLVKGEEERATHDSPTRFRRVDLLDLATAPGIRAGPGLGT